jgi:hypothetical protein
LFGDLDLGPLLALRVGQLGELHQHHHCQKGEFLVLLMEDQNRNQVLLQEVPPA